MARGFPLVRGAAAACVAGSLAYGAALLAGVVPDASHLVFLVGGVAGAIVAVAKPNNPRTQAVGALIVGAGAVVFGLSTGFDWLAWSAVFGSVLAAVWLLIGEPRPMSPRAWFRWGGVLIPLLAFLLLPLVLEGGTLGVDEAAYGLKARSWLEGTPDTGWDLHRGLGMSVYGYLVLAAGGSEAGLRMLGLVGLLALVAGVWALGSVMTHPRVGALAAIAIASGPAILYRSTEYLSDVPAAALLVFCMVVVWREFAKRDFPTYRLLWILPLAWTAFYLRYQSILSFALIALITAVLWWPKIKARPRPVLVVMMVGLIGFIPHAITAVSLTGSPFGLVTYTAGLATRAYVGEGLVDYSRQLLWPLAGFVGPIAVVFAIAGLVWSRRNSEIRQRYLFLLVPALLQGVALGLLSHGEPRFVFFPLALVVVAGASSIEAWVTRGSSRVAVPVVCGLAVLLFGSLAVSAVSARHEVEMRAGFYLPAEAAALEVRNQIGELTCGVVTNFTGITTFYSQCATRGFFADGDPALAVEALEGEGRFMVLIEDGRGQPQGDDLERLIELAEGPPVIIEGTSDAAVYRFAD